ncbi:helix-turn-helix domain-containing protein [Haladaptatus sp. DYF46]|uniref:winged helix-turn-helix domain-containing protein n=1 Tax=Haladaptatus sp. DYF46 TaxID=2886041 RepID=UPI001E2B23F9|nr:helix-turn-helix domain-containing protein [Haladaptatus sp. DYF46]
MTNGTEPSMDALSVLGNEIRMSILRELADASETLSFTELRERVGVRDTGKFNYHLTKLCEYFVRQTESGYELGHAGTRVISAATPVATDEFEGEEDDTCPVCGEEDCEKLFHVHLTPGRF